jgi:integrase
MPTANLTEITVRALKGSEKYETVFDTNLPAFGIRIGKRRKTWVVVRGRSRERITIGHYPDLGVADARAEAKRLLAVDPAPRTVKKTFREARDEFLAQHYADKSANTKYQVERSLKRNCKTLEAMQLADIEDADLDRCMGKLGNRPSEQLHLFRYLRTFFRWCTRPPRRYLKHSPMEGYEAPAQEGRRSRILSDEEIKAVWNAVQKPQEGVVRLLLILGTRRGETCLLERKWASDGVLTIPGFQDGQRITKNGRTHALPLTELAEKVLASLPGIETYFLPGRWGRGHITPRGLSQVVAEVRKRSQTHDWTPHDLRRTFRSIAARVGVPREIAELLMNHAPPVLEDIYDRHSYLPEKREALQKISDFIQTLAAG